MSEVARAEGVPPTFGQSPFAIARGDTFERSLFYDDGRRILDGLIEKDVLPEGAVGLADFRIRLNRGPLSDLEAAIDATAAFVASVARQRTGLAVRGCRSDYQDPQGRHAS